ncbi:hypothetical protein ONE63_003270 [Megalurothrips usitatus]|uniref:Uncharacterized protein n=1 Tax=Megalurothrips usitatus TaxID=439358 RepID=A0AAV7X6S9_9NEOP|nr:hypothetical protein ONE63_003270 [Megalurothrips usitatus]
MTLGQAFEVAYQMALKDQLRADGVLDRPQLHTRSNSVSGPSGPSAVEAAANGSPSASRAANGTANGAAHVRSKSCGEHPLAAAAAPKLVLTEDV